MLKPYYLDVSGWSLIDIISIADTDVDYVDADHTASVLETCFL